MEAYRKLYRATKAADKLQMGGFYVPGSGDEPSGPRGKTPFDVLLEPGTMEDKDPTVASLERNEAEWRTVCETAHQIAKLRGNMPAGLERLFTDAVEPHVPWAEHVETVIARTLGSDGYNWRRPDRRLIIRDIYAPGRTGHAAKLIVVGGDTSGSINEPTMNMWMAELAGMFEELKPAQLVIMWCDAEVHDVDWCDEPGDLNIIRKRGVHGGGGTKFFPVFDKISELGLEPDALIYLTDGYGEFPDVEPAYPVVWGTIGLEPEDFPFGEAVKVPEQVK
jgi:predicted metal-dependent peptidase